MPRLWTLHESSTGNPGTGGAAGPTRRRRGPGIIGGRVSHDVRVRRVSVVGNAGSGKTRLARRIADVIAVPHVELDAIHHLPGWKAIDPDTFLAEVDAITSMDGWVIDGNYRTVVVDGPVWQRADTVVWIDPPRRRVMRQVVTRTLRRITNRQELWNGNREPIKSLYAWDPHDSIIRWAWTQHAKYQERFGTAMTSPAFSHLTFVRLKSRAETETWIKGLRRGQTG
jgi:adenylate kinase family enzyme